MLCQQCGQRPGLVRAQGQGEESNIYAVWCPPCANLTPGPNTIYLHTGRKPLTASWWAWMQSKGGRAGWRARLRAAAERYGISTQTAEEPEDYA